MSPLPPPLPLRSGTAGLRLIPTLELEGCRQMAIDAWLLEQSLEALPAAAPVLRFYRWSRPTLSLGFHQRRIEPHWRQLATRGELQLVRRPSGGRAVLHAGELTYALIWPAAPARRRQAYQLACEWLRQGFATVGAPLVSGSEPALAQESGCFARATAADLIHPCGAKRIGSAQLWRRGHLLQHGSILIDPPADLWRQVFGSAPPALPPLPLTVQELEQVLCEAAQRHLPFAASIAWQSRGLSALEWAAITGLEGRYRLSPESPDSATGAACEP